MTRPDATSWRRAVLTMSPRSPFTGPRPDRSFRTATRRLSNLDSAKPSRARISKLTCPDREGEFDITGVYQIGEPDAAVWASCGLDAHTRPTNDPTAFARHFGGDSRPPHHLRAARPRR